MYSARVVIASIRLAARLASADRASLVFGAIQSITSAALGLVVLYVIFEKSSLVGGWDFPGARFVFGLFMLVDGVAGVFFLSSLGKLPSQIRGGQIDSMLLSPVDARVLMMLGSINIWRCGDILVGLIIMSFSYEILTFQSVIFGFFFLLLGFCVLYAVWLICISITLSVVRLDNVAQLLSLPILFNRFPMHAYPKWLSILLLNIIPVGFIAYVPASVFANEASGLRMLQAFLMAGLSVLAANAAYARSLRKFEGI